jgi:hypothetical protein
LNEAPIRSPREEEGGKASGGEGGGIRRDERTVSEVVRGELLACAESGLVKGRDLGRGRAWHAGIERYEVVGGEERIGRGDFGDADE